MLDIVRLLNDKFVEKLAEGYSQTFADNKPEYKDLICRVASRITNTIAQSNTLYHNVEHTVQVTLVGQCVLQGKLQSENNVSPEIWLNFICALMCHDVGYVRGICRADSDGDESPSQNQQLENLTSDAVLMPYHIDRGKQFAAELLGQEQGIDVPFIQKCIERTRFPVPDEPEYQATDDFPGLVRGADLVGQLSDPRYLQKIPAVFFEFEESGYNRITGYKKPGDLIRHYADFYQYSVEPYVKETLHYLSLSEQGREVVDSLLSNIQLAEDARRA